MMSYPSFRRCLMTDPFYASLFIKCIMPMYFCLLIFHLQYPLALYRICNMPTATSTEFLNMSSVFYFSCSLIMRYYQNCMYFFWFGIRMTFCSFLCISRRYEFYSVLSWAVCFTMHSALNSSCLRSHYFNYVYYLFSNCKC